MLNCREVGENQDVVKPQNDLFYDLKKIEGEGNKIEATHRLSNLMDFVAANGCEEITSSECFELNDYYMINLNIVGPRKRSRNLVY